MKCLGNLESGDFKSDGRGINDFGHISGFSQSALGHEAFFWTPRDGMNGLGTLTAGPESEAWGINNRDEVIGWSDTDHGVEAFIWDPVSGMRGLGDFDGGKFESRARAINNAGQVTGFGIPARGLSEAYI